MTEKSNQELQEEIDFLKGQVECLTGMAALHLAAYFLMTENITDSIDIKLQVRTVKSEEVLKEALDKGMRSAKEEQSQHYVDGFNETVNHYLDVLRGVDREPSES
ncbi:MAG: hypothetical protein F4Y61_06295 [Rhodothermaceae bacterium]|nr:hypothetical protein [Rhodothermaceae bacterium]